ncbi:hypothetical protein BGZ83_009206, partial [Gryganskiella cystojenkinii]
MPVPSTSAYLHRFEIQQVSDTSLDKDITEPEPPYQQQGEAFHQNKVVVSNIGPSGYQVPTTITTTTTTTPTPNPVTAPHLHALATGASERIPPEIWHMILSYLPTSQVAAFSLVSHSILLACRSFPRWQVICELNGLSKPPPGCKVYKSIMAFICSEAWFLCDCCDGQSIGWRQFQLSEIPVPIQRQDDQGQTWRLCLLCRVEYFKKFPRANRMFLRQINPKEEVSRDYLTMLLSFSKEEITRCSPRTISGSYGLRDVIRLGLEIHGGEPGLVAVQEAFWARMAIRYFQRKKRDQITA